MRQYWKRSPDRFPSGCRKDPAGRPSRRPPALAGWCMAPSIRQCGQSRYQSSTGPFPAGSHPWRQSIHTRCPCRFRLRPRSAAPSWRRGLPPWQSGARRLRTGRFRVLCGYLVSLWRPLPVFGIGFTGHL